MADSVAAAGVPADSSHGQKKFDERERVWIGKSDKVFEFFILFLIYILAFATRLFSVIRFESVIHEFDPWFNFRVTKYLVKEGFYNFHNWFDDMTWYPLGRYIGGTLYPGLMWTAALIFHVLNRLHFTVDIRNVCVLLAPFMASNTSIVVYLLTKESWNSAAGLVAAALVSITPGYISRSVAGSYDNEAVAIFALTLTFFLWVRAVRTGSIFWSGMCALGYFYMVASWGGYIFIINLIPFHVLALLVCGRYSHRLYVAYSVFFVLGTLMSMTISFVSFIPVTSPEHMPSIGVFGILQLYWLYHFIQHHVSREHLRYIVMASVALIGALFVVSIILSILGYVPLLTGRLLALLGSTKNIAIVKSVSEHQPSAWTTFFFDFHVLTAMAAVGMFYGYLRLTDTTMFSILYLLFSSYFASIMVRLVLVLAPAICVMGAIGISETYRKFSDLLTQSDDESDEASAAASKKSTAPARVEETKDSKEERDVAAVVSASLRKKKEKPGFLDDTISDNHVHSAISWLVIFALTAIMCFYTIHCTWVTSIAYSSPSVVLQSRNADGSRTVFDDFRESYYWLSQNTAPDAKIMSWWDYGYQITGMGNRTVIVDNNTRNNTHIATVGLAMASTEEMAYPILLALDVDYVLVVFGGKIGYSSDDINKFLWMVRISSGVYPRIVENDFFSPSGHYRIDDQASSTMLNCMMYKMCYYRFGEGATEWGQPAGFDRVRRSVIGKKDISFKYLEEAFTSEHWMVRIYRVLRNKDQRIGGANFPAMKTTHKAAARKVPKEKKEASGKATKAKRS